MEEFPKPKYMVDMGSYNTMPVPYKEITHDEFMHSFFIYCLEVQDYRQVHEEPNNRMSKLLITRFFWFQTFGIAIQEFQYYPEQKYKYYRLGCEHNKTKEVSSWDCYHKVDCLDCGLHWEYDSSG
jgi:hypothetical protein